MSSSIWILKWSPLYIPWEGPQKLASQVNEFYSWNSLNMTTRPVDSLALCIAKEQPLKLNCGQSLSYIRGKTCSLYFLSLCDDIMPVWWLLQPYMKMSFCLECPWKSQYKSILRHSNVFRIICLIALHSGKSLGLGFMYWRLRSWPERLQR